MLRAASARGGALAALVGLLLVALAAPALAVGADGVSMQVTVPRDADQRVPMLVEGTPASGAVRVRNRNEEGRTVRLYPVSAERVEATGSVALGTTGSAPWIGLEAAELTLGPGEERVLTFTLDPAGVPGGTDGRLPTAFVLEVPRGDTVVMRAVSLLSVTGAVPPATPWHLFAIAAALLLAVGQKAARELRRGRSLRGGLPALAPA